MGPACTVSPLNGICIYSGLGILLSYRCGIIRGQKVIRAKDRINLMSRCDTGIEEATVNNEEFF